MRKQPKRAGLMRTFLALNVGKLIGKKYAALPNMTARYKQLAKDSGLGYGTIRRIMAEETAATIDNVEHIALALDVMVYQLFIPNLDPDNPQVAHGASYDEKLLYGKFGRPRRKKQRTPK